MPDFLPLPSDPASQTDLVRAGLSRSAFGETSEGLFLTSGFVYPDAETAQARFAGENEGFIYSRYGNPTVDVFEQRLAKLEQAEACFATSSGMAAVFAALMCQLQAGDHVVASQVLFGSCSHIITKLLPKYGITYTLVDGGDLQAWEAAITSQTKVFFFESPANPTLDLVDIAGLVALAKAHTITTVLDNAFASAIVQKAIPMGIDIVITSATKHIDGQGRCLGGAVLSSETFRNDLLMPFMRHTGPAMSAFNAWVLAKSLETLKLRVQYQAQSALELAQALEQHPKIERVFYPYLSSFQGHELALKQMQSGGTIVSFHIKGGQDAAFQVMNALKVVDISNNLGDAKSLITHPLTTTHRAMDPEIREVAGITGSLVRLSVGLEETGDVFADLDQAFRG